MRIDMQEHTQAALRHQRTILRTYDDAAACGNYSVLIALRNHCQHTAFAGPKIVFPMLGKNRRNALSTLPLYERVNIE
jgi:hypothetical protein